MYIFFLDEAGHTGLKKGLKQKNIDEQPYLVWSAVGYHADELPKVCSDIEKERIDNRELIADLGEKEIKGRDVRRGYSGKTKITSKQRDFFRKLYLIDCLKKATFFLCILDKASHTNHYYSSAYAPLSWALHLLCERIVKYMKEKEESCILIIDQDKKEEPGISKYLYTLRTEGSHGATRDGQHHFHLAMDRILGATFTDSKHFELLRVADFIVTLIYQECKKISKNNLKKHLHDKLSKEGQQIIGEPCNKEQLIWKSLREKIAKNHSGDILGIGLKIFP